jgi:hypothetical protein
MNIDVVVDDNISHDGAVPIEVPIYFESKRNNLCFNLDINICKKFKMRFRNETFPPVRINYNASKIFINEDTGDGDINSLFTGFSKKPPNCSPWESRLDYFTLQGDANGILSIIVENPKTGKEYEVGRINVFTDLERTLCLDIFFIKDEMGSKSEYIDLEGAEQNTRINQLFKILNTYWSQCLVCYEPRIKGTLNVKGDIRDRFSINGSESPRIVNAIISRGRNTILGMNKELKNVIYFVDDVWQESTANDTAGEPVSIYSDVAGFTFTDLSKESHPYNITFMDNTGVRGISGVVLGHELLHGISNMKIHEFNECYLDKIRYSDGIIKTNWCEFAKMVVSRRYCDD